MNILIDTHTFLWFISGNQKISDTARKIIEKPENQPLISVASLWEMAIKLSLGKLNMEQPFEPFITTQLAINGIDVLAITTQHLSIVATLPYHHRYPFDRLIIAQGMAENLPILSADTAFDAYPINRLW